MGDNNFEKETIKVFRAADPEKKMTEISVIRWIKDGRGFSPQLVNQEVYIDKIDKKVKNGKIKGLKAADFALILEHREEITELLSDHFTPERTRVDTQKKAANDESVVPW